MWQAALVSTNIERRQLTDTAYPIQMTLISMPGFMATNTNNFFSHIENIFYHQNNIVLNTA